jgi:hypothetical protein
MLPEGRALSPNGKEARVCLSRGLFWGLGLVASQKSQSVLCKVRAACPH